MVVGNLEGRRYTMTKGKEVVFVEVTDAVLNELVKIRDTTYRAFLPIIGATSA